MPAAFRLPTRPTLFAVLLSLAACAAPRTDIRGASATPARVTAQTFGDADPVDWPGRKPSSYPVHGVDMSRWQGPVDWSAAQAAGVSFVFLKATEGTDIADPGFRAHWDGAGRAGVARGAYHFMYHCSPATRQARWFIRNVPVAPGALPPVLDIEDTPFSPTCPKRPSPDAIRAEAAAFLRVVERHYGRAAIVYTTPDFYARNELWRVPGGHEFWLRSVADHPSETFRGQHWTFWQYSGTGLVPGVRGQVDLNAFAGSRAAWADWLARRAR